MNDGGIPIFIGTWDPYFHMKVGTGSPISYHLRDLGPPIYVTHRYTIIREMDDTMYYNMKFTDDSAKMNYSHSF